MIMGDVLAIFGNGQGLPKSHHNKVKMLMQQAYDEGMSRKSQTMRDSWQNLLTEMGIENDNS